MSCDKAQIMLWLSEVLDPEVPVLDIVSMGMVRDVEIADSQVTVIATPTYSGCPALAVIAREICEKLTAQGITRPKVRWQLAPAWTTDWLTEEAKEKLEQYGIAPPELCRISGADSIVPFSQLSKKPPCPQCKSLNTRITSEFGATACKSLCVCNDCKEPFEYFKAF